MRFFAVAGVALAFLSSPVLSVPVASSRAGYARALLTRQEGAMEARDIHELLLRALDDDSGAASLGGLFGKASQIMNGLSIGSTIADLAKGLFHHGNSTRRDYDDSGAIALAQYFNNNRPYYFGRGPFIGSLPASQPSRRQYDEPFARDDLFGLLARGDFDSEAVSVKPLLQMFKNGWQAIKPHLPTIVGVGSGLIPSLLPSHSNDGGNQTARRDYDELIARGDMLFELIARDLDESGASFLTSIINGAKRLLPKVKPYLPTIGGAVIGAAPALLPSPSSNSGNQTQTRREFEDFHLFLRALDDESGVTVMQKIQEWAPKVVEWAIPIATQYVENHKAQQQQQQQQQQPATPQTKTRRGFDELLARFNEQQERRDAFDFVARALTEREVDLD